MDIIQKFELHRPRKHGFRFASKLMTVIAMGAFGAMTCSLTHAQETDSRIVGKAPAGDTITVHSDTGMTRHGTASSKGRYSLSELRPGTYVVLLEKDGKTLASQSGVPLFVGRASEVDFACNNDQCSASIGH